MNLDLDIPLFTLFNSYGLHCKVMEVPNVLVILWNFLGNKGLSIIPNEEGDSVLISS